MPLARACEKGVPCSAYLDQPGSKCAKSKRAEEDDVECDAPAIVEEQLLLGVARGQRNGTCTCGSSTPRNLSLVPLPVCVRVCDTLLLGR